MKIFHKWCIRVIGGNHFSVVWLSIYLKDAIFIVYFYPTIVVVDEMATLDSLRRTAVRRMWERSDLLPKHPKSKQNLNFSFLSPAFVRV